MTWFKYVWIVLIILFWLFMTGATVWDITTTVKKDREDYPDLFSLLSLKLNDLNLFSSIIGALDEFSSGWIAFNIAVLFVASLICWLKYR